MDAPGVALERPVGDFALDQAGVRDNDVDVVIGADAGRARADLDDGAARIIQFDIIADRHHPVEDQEQARDELLDHALKAEAQTDADGPGEHGQRRQVQTGG